jgi:tetratricopeptide (TPR) repeat protein
MGALAEPQFEAALRAAQDPAASPDERAAMLMQIGMALQVRPKSARQLRDAVSLYQQALSQPPSSELLTARIRSRMGTALQSIPGGGGETLQQACECHELALPVLSALGGAEEKGAAHLHLGLAIQALCGLGIGRVQEAIQHYHEALRVFGEDHPKEFAIVHNNLAIAYLAIPITDERARAREALAAQSFEEVLKVVTLVDHPGEYAMIQNNLGNLLQYAASGHVLQNKLRALAAYDEALKVRNVRDTPLEYANTIANKANVLRNLPVRDESDDDDSIFAALTLYREARQIFTVHGLKDRAELMAAAIAQIGAEHAREPAHLALERERYRRQ